MEGQRPRPTGGGAPRGGQLSGLDQFLNRLFLWPLRCCPQGRKEGIGGEQDWLASRIGSRTEAIGSFCCLTPHPCKAHALPPQNRKEWKTQDFSPASRKDGCITRSSRHTPFLSRPPPPLPSP